MTANDQNDTRQHTANFEYQYRKRGRPFGPMVEVKHCMFCGKELTGKGKYRSYCDGFCFVMEFHRVYCKEKA